MSLSTPLTAADYLVHLQALLPSGLAWPRGADATLTRTLDGLAQELARVDARATQLVDESDPRTADELLADWERVLGLPDDCMVTLALSKTDRRAIAAQRLTEQGGQSRAYFIALAEQLGQPGCTITEFAPANCNSNCNSALYSEADRFVWRMNIPGAAAGARAANCNDDCNDALQIWQPSLVECPITERKPAHTTVIFSYA